MEELERPQDAPRLDSSSLTFPSALWSIKTLRSRLPCVARRSYLAPRSAAVPAAPSAALPLPLSPLRHQAVSSSRRSDLVAQSSPWSVSSALHTKTLGATLQKSPWIAQAALQCGYPASTFQRSTQSPAEC